MDFTPDPDEELIREAVRAVCARFDDNYWSERDARHEFPWDFYAAMADGGWVGIAIPEAYGGGGPGVDEAALVLAAGAAPRAAGGWVGRAIPEAYGRGGRGTNEASLVLEDAAASGAARNGCSAVRLSI